MADNRKNSNLLLCITILTLSQIAITMNNCGKYCENCLIYPQGQGKEPLTLCGSCITTPGLGLVPCQTFVKNCFVGDITAVDPTCYRCKINYFLSLDRRSCRPVPTHYQGKSLRGCVLGQYSLASGNESAECLACIEGSAINHESGECTEPGNVDNCSLHGKVGQCAYCVKGFLLKDGECVRYEIEGCAEVKTHPNLGKYCSKCDALHFWYATSSELVQYQNKAPTFRVDIFFKNKCEYYAPLLQFVTLMLIFKLLWIF